MAMKNRPYEDVYLPIKNQCFCPLLSIAMLVFGGVLDAIPAHLFNTGSPESLPLLDSK